MANVYKKSALAVLFVSSIAASSQARSQSAGNPILWSPADAGCFTTHHGSVKNVCSTEKGINFVVSTDTANDKYVNVSGLRPAYSSLRCQAVGLNHLYTQTWANGFVSSPVVDTPNEFTLNRAYVPPHGSLVIQCLLGRDAVVYSFDWNQ